MANPYFLTWQEILDQMIVFLPPAWRPNQSGKVIKRILVSVALTIEGLYAQVARSLRLSLPATSEGQWLRAIARSFNMTFYDGVKAKVYVRFERTTATNTEAIAIPLGSRVVATNGQVFSLDTELAIAPNSQFADGFCTATLPGVAGNILAGEIVGLSPSVNGVRAFNLVDASGGIDSETDQSIRGRLPPHLENLHRSTIPATEGAISTVLDEFPEVISFVTQRKIGINGYFRGVLQDLSGGDFYRCRNWTPVNNGIYQMTTNLDQIHGLVLAGFPCKRFGILTRSTSGEEEWRASTNVPDLLNGDYRFFFDAQNKIIYARATGENLNELPITIYAGVIWKALRTLELDWAANGVYLDVIVPFAEFVSVTLTYFLEPGHNQLTVDAALKQAISTYLNRLRVGQDFELEGVYSALNLVGGASSIRLTSPTDNVPVPSDAIARPAHPPIVEKVN